MMKRKEYIRYQEQLTSNSVVTFSSGKELIAFMSGIFSKDYLYYLRLCEKAAATQDEREQIDARKFSELRQVRETTRNYLEKYMSRPEGFLNMILAKFGRAYVPAPLVIDVVSNTGLYAKLLEKIGRGDTPENTFSPGVRYIVNGNTVRRQVL